MMNMINREMVPSSQISRLSSPTVNHIGRRKRDEVNLEEKTDPGLDLHTGENGLSVDLRSGGIERTDA